MSLIRKHGAVLQAWACLALVLGSAYTGSHTGCCVQGKDLQRGSRISDYDIAIGSAECSASFLSDNLLTCRPPYDEPEPSHDDAFCHKYNSVLVRELSEYRTIS